jgi:hypothetical protein
MSDQIVKHDNSLPGFLLILLPAAFAAVFLSIAWPFILGGIVFLTGNSVWQSYQWAKLSQQVNPYFNQMVLEQQGEIAPLALSARANISAPVADRYLQGKAAEIGGVSYRSEAGGNVYSFLTVNSLENTFAGLSSNKSLSQKLAELDYVLVDAESASSSKTLDSQTLEQSTPVQPVSTSIATLAPEVVAVAPEVLAKVMNSPTEQEQPAPTVVAVAPANPTETAAKIVQPAPVTPVATEAVTLTEPVRLEPVVAKVAIEPQAPAKITKIAEETITSGSSFAQALRGIFDAGNEPVAEEAIELEEMSTVAETITQADLAKRLDVHPSTLYKRRSDVSFGDWTRNRDPEGFGWGYQRDTKEFYRLA